MKYILKNGKTIVIRKVVVNDASSIINIISTADIETKFLARNPGEFCITEEQEKNFIRQILNNDNKEWYVVEYEGKIVGQCSVGLVSEYERYTHRAEASFVILKNFCGLGIGGKLMQECINWCNEKNVIQIELRVIADNKKAIDVYEAFGFNTIGTIPKAMRYKDGTYANEKIMILELKK